MKSFDTEIKFLKLRHFIRLIGVSLIQIFLESLILAQDERWRRA